MNRILFILGVTALLASCKGKMTATDYNQTIMNAYNEITANFDACNATLQENKKKEANALFLEGKKIIKTHQKSLQKLNDFEGNTTYRASIMDLVEFYDHTYKHDFKELVQLVCKDQQDTEDTLVISNLKKKISDLRNKFEKEFYANHMLFCRNYEVTVDAEIWKKKTIISY